MNVYGFNDVTHVALADWLWKEGEYLPKTIAFASVYAPKEPLVITFTDESWGKFSMADIRKNVNLHPLTGFNNDPGTAGQKFEIERLNLEYFMKTQFLPLMLKSPVKVGTYDMATFMLLEPIMENSMVFIGPRIEPELAVTRMAMRR